MIRCLFGGIIVALCILMAQCNNPGSPDDGASIVIRLMEADSTTVSDSLVVALNSKPATDLSGEEAVKMEDLITNDFIAPYVDKDNASWDKRTLYGYRIIGSDGFSPHQKTDQETGRTADDLTWEQIQHGYIKKNSRDAAYDASVTLAGMYRVKEVAVIELYRTINVVIDTGATQTKCQMRLAEMEKADFSGNASVRLSVILALVANSDSLHYTVTALDGYTGMSPFTWAQMQTGYWIQSTDKLGFDPDLGGQSRISYVKEITVSK
ncbi:MAG: hypothetical protein JW768_06770 [Chitinispirillaceae bacterium]|nr:hypothetical protein [Chitinispirillaceae bacterium]